MSNKPYPSLQPQQWLVQRLKNIAQSDPRFEASWYGPYNALLNHYFPYQQRFLIKPQAKVSDEEEADISFSSVQAETSIDGDKFCEGDAAAETSMTSFGGLVIRGTGNTYIPDFVVTKATQFVSHDTPLIVVEVKVGEPGKESDWTTREHQMETYMESLSGKTGDSRQVIGLLINGTKAKIFRLRNSGSSIEIKDSAIHSVNSKMIRQLLLSISKDNWEY